MDLKSIIKILQNQSSSVQLPQTIQFQEENGTITLTLNKQAIGLGPEPLNMQNNASAFEGWALALYVHLFNTAGTVILNAPVPKTGETQFDEKNGHYHRFLYRAMKFSEQFRWFKLAPELSETVAQFKAYLKTTRFVNNIGQDEAGTSGTLENTVEGLLSAKGSDLLQKIASTAGISIGDHFIFRQLPVGLFREQKADELRFFSGNKSAIDLWTESGDTISIFELKVQNKMIGMVTELFFYANYVYDMFCDTNSSFCPLPAKGHVDNRGYASLLTPEGQKFHKKVQAFFLYDGEQIHPLISDAVVAVLNQGTENIQYAKLSYQLDGFPI